MDSAGSFRSDNPDQVSGLYFPLCNEEGLLSAITPDLHGDIKLDIHSFLTLPVSTQDLHTNLSSRNFWISTGDSHWSVTGQSAWQKALKKGEEKVELEAGFLWQRIKRSNKKLGLEAVTLNFVPTSGEKLELMMVEVKNTSRKPLTIKATSALPLFGRSADNLRDHRHVTSLLNRLSWFARGVVLHPTMSFNERGHLKNTISYFVGGADEKGSAPLGGFPTVTSFIGEGGSLDKPRALFENFKPRKSILPADQGQEAMAALQFKPVRLAAGQSTTFILTLGIDPSSQNFLTWTERFKTKEAVLSALEDTRAFWEKEISRIQFHTGDKTFNNWVRWVQVQPTLRKIFGNSFLPDFDYGRGGRGWRDLWQDCLALLLSNPTPVRKMVLHNFGGVRMDGTNATIIGKNKEFIADRNNISRTWMDHGIWPFLTTRLYLHQTGDWDLLLEKAPYFAGNSHGGTLLEHILVQNLTPFFNVGEHNIIRLEDADWNDGLDMAPHRGESVAFTHMYGSNLEALAELLETVQTKKGWTSVEVAEEVMILLDQIPSGGINYEMVYEKRTLLKKYSDSISKGTSGKKMTVAFDLLIADLRAKSRWIKEHLNKQEIVETDGHRWFNGYYDDDGNRVEGKNNQGRTLMTLTGQVFPILGGIAEEKEIADIVKAVEAHLYDSKLGGYRLNTDFGSERHNLGRAFSFAFGEKENGAVFSHMVVMYANALYQRGFVEAGNKALSSLYRMAVNSERSRIFPGIPEYFNNEGRGRYHYLTGSASWYVLTLLTQVLGVRGQDGDLLLAPKLMPDQFDRKGEARATSTFADVRITVVYRNPRKLSYARMRVEKVTDQEGENVEVSRPSEKEVLIPRSYLKGKKDLTLVVLMT